MKKWLVPLFAAFMMVGMSACGDASSTSSPAQTTKEVHGDLNWDNNNTDPYKGWVGLHRDSRGHVDVFLRCSSQSTGTYITYATDAVSMNTVVKSPDCPAK